MENRIAAALERLFDKHRIVFWYDVKNELKSDFDALDMKGIEKCEISNNEFTLKHCILREKPKQKFLLYKAGAQPADLDNWLLDVQLAHGEFRTDQSAIWLSELNLPNEFMAIVDNHTAFFESAKRKEDLKKRLSAEDTLGMARLKMLSVCAAADTRIDSILEHLLDELASDKETALKLIERCQLQSFLWEQVKRHYGYYSDSPSLKDFVITLFKYAYFQSFNGSTNTKLPSLNNDALVFLKRWKDSRPHQAAFEYFSAECADILDIEADLVKRDVKDLLELDYFILIDRKIISSLVQAVQARTVSSGDITIWCRQRRQSHWYDKFEDLYSAVDVAGQFLALLDLVSFHTPSASEMVANYTRHWFKLDQLYRQYIYALKVSGQTTLLNELTEQIENFYTNRYLLPLSNEWQRHVDAMTHWQVEEVIAQPRFYNQWVKPYLTKNQKIYVIISDAFRYEIGEEMVSRIRQEDRYQADLECTLSVLPSFTQLGMAASLPRGEADASLSLDTLSGVAYIGGQSTQGTANRDKALKTVVGERARAMKSGELIEMTALECRELLKDHDVIYFYHNRIDHAGDKMQSEGEAFEAAEKTFEDLLKLIKKLTSANASNILITADHGFIYQNRPIEESDFLSIPVTENVYKDRRFLLGESLNMGDSFKQFNAQQLGLSGDVNVAIPKGIQRLRLSGSGSRFVHGGATLQEVIVPVIKINKSRQSDTSIVEVEIIRSGSNVITSGQLAVALYQVEPVSDKVQPRRLRAGIYTQADQLISDQHEIVMDFTSENTREREIKLRFLLSQEADAANNQEVTLRLDELVSGTSHYKNYKSISYTIRRSFASDFDF